MNDWPMLKLGDVATVTAGTSAPQGDKYFDGGQFNFVRTQDVGRYGFTTSLIETKDRVNELAIREKRLKKARKGASVFPKSGASILTNSRAMLGCDSYIVSHLAIVDANHALLDDYYLHYFLRTVDFGEIAQSEEGYPSLRLSEVSELAIPVPPIDEQRRIVARIEELIRRAEEARQLRQEALEEVGNTVTAFIDQLLYDLPRSCWKPIGTYAKLQGGYAFKSEWFSEGGMRLLRNQNIYHDAIEWSNDKTVFLPNAMVHEFERFALLEGDIVLTMDRPLIKSGLKASRIRQKDLPCLLLQRVGRFLCSDEINKDYLFQCLLSQVFTSQISGSERSNAVPHISSKQVEGISIPIPPLAVQLEVVEKTEKFREKLTLLCSLQNETSNDLEAFQSALLAKAFRGEL